MVLLEGKGAENACSGIGGRLGWCLMALSYFDPVGKTEVEVYVDGACVTNGTLK